MIETIGASISTRRKDEHAGGDAESDFEALGSPRTLQSKEENTKLMKELVKTSWPFRKARFRLSLHISAAGSGSGTGPLWRRRKDKMREGLRGETVLDRSTNFCSLCNTRK